MSKENKVLQGLGIPFSALVSVIFGLMILSFPIGAYVVFNSDIENEINFDYPIQGFPIFPAGIGFEVPIEFELGDAFIILWVIFVIIFAIASFGPKKNFLSTLMQFMSEGKQELASSYLITAIKWFTILIVISASIGYIQESVGIQTEPPEQSNLLVHFFQVSSAPLVEEIGFRVMLIGIPLFLIYSHKSSIRLFFKSLWHPSKNLHILESKKSILLIISVGVFFGLAHIITGESWSLGKFAQASVSGVILGWVYFKHGFVPALLIHWATNYFIFSYVYFLADINEITIQNAFSHSLTSTLESLLIITGVISIAIVVINYFKLKNSVKNLERF